MTRGKLIAFRATEKERQTLEVLAARENRSLSEMLRECLREAAIKRGLYAVGLVQLISKYEVGGANEDK